MNLLQKHFLSDSPKATEQFAEKLAQEFAHGATVLLFGELGAGKTTFTRGICQKFGIDSVKSPSFVLVNVYANDDITIYHIDLYRVPELDYATAGEIAEYLWDDDAIKIVEWAERLNDELLPTNYIAIKIERISDNERQITWETHND